MTWLATAPSLAALVCPSTGNDQADSLDALRGLLVELLRARSPDVERAIVDKGLDIEPVLNAGPEGYAGLQAFARSGVDVLATAIEGGADWTPGLSPAAVAQIRFWARNDVPLDAVMRGFYSVTSTLLEFLSEELADLPPEALPYLASIQTQHGGQLMEAIATEYEDEVARLDRSPAKRVASCVARLLAGESLDAPELGYELEAWHLGAVAVGPKPELFARELAERLGCQLLFLPRATETAWIWLGAKRAVPFAELERSVLSGARTDVSLAVGEPREGADGWRLTHQEAQTALAVMLRRPQRLTRCSDVVLSAALMRDEEMRRFLVEAYLRPLEECRDAETLRETLRTYVSLDYNAASTAATLGVDRHTVQRRLRRIEEAIGRQLDTCRAELDIALRVELLTQPAG